MYDHNHLNLFFSIILRANATAFRPGTMAGLALMLILMTPRTSKSLQTYTSGSPSCSQMLLRHKIPMYVSETSRSRYQQQRLFPSICSKIHKSCPGVVEVKSKPEQKRYINQINRNRANVHKGTRVRGNECEGKKGKAVRSTELFPKNDTNKEDENGDDSSSHDTLLVHSLGR